MREIHWREDLSDQDFCTVNLTDAYFGECSLDGTKFGPLPNVTFYACTGSPDFSCCPDLSTSYFRQNKFLSILLPPGPTPTQHDIVSAVLRTVAASRPTISMELIGVADRIQLTYSQSWLDYYAWMTTQYGVERTREVVRQAFETIPLWRERFDEVDNGNS